MLGEEAAQRVHELRAHRRLPQRAEQPEHHAGRGCAVAIGAVQVQAARKVEQRVWQQELVREDRGEEERPPDALLEVVPPRRGGGRPAERPAEAQAEGGRLPGGGECGASRN